MQTKSSRLKYLGLLEVEPVITQVFTDEPDGEPEPSRVAEGQSPFLHRTITTRQVIKSIVITDPTLLTHIFYNAEMSKCLLLSRFHISAYRELQKLGCQIYFWNGDQIVFYDPEKDEGYQFLYHILQIPWVTNKSALLESARLKKISSDLVCLADEKFHSSPHFLLENNSYWGMRTVGFDELEQYKSELRLMITPPFHSKLFESKIPNFEKLQQLCVRGLNQKNSFEIIPHAPQLKTLKFSLINFEGRSHFPPMPTIDNLMITNCVLSINALSNLLKQCPQLTKLDLIKNSCGNDNLDKIDFPSLKHLRQLSCKHSRIPVQLINARIKILEIHTNNINHIEGLTPEKLSGLQAAFIDSNNQEIIAKLIQLLPKDLKFLSIKSLINKNEQECREILAKFPQCKAIVFAINSDKISSHEYKQQSIEADTKPVSESMQIQLPFTEDGRPLMSELRLDSNTKELGLVYRSPILFKTNDKSLDNPSLYRLKVYNKLTYDVEPYSEYKWEIYKDYKVSQDLEKEFQELPAIKAKNAAWSILDILPDAGKQILFSLSPNEKLIVVQLISEHSNAQVEIFYDKRTRLYAATSNCPVKLKYMLEVNRKLYHAEQKHDENTKKIIAKYAGFKPGDLQLTEDVSPQELLRMVKKRGLGTCPHRSIACKDDLADQANLIANGSHVFIEIYDSEGVGFTVDLGGASSRFEYVPFDSENKIKSCTSISEEKTRLSFFSNQLEQKSKLQLSLEEMKKYERPRLTLSGHSIQDCFDDIVKLSDKPLLLLTSSEDQMRGLMNEAVDYCRENKKESYYIDDLDEFHESSFRYFLKNVTEESLLFIRWDKNKKIKSEHVGLNSLFDIPPMLEGKPLPKKLKVIALAEQSSVLTEDIRSRFRGRIIPLPSQLDIPSGNADYRKFEKSSEPSILLWKKMIEGSADTALLYSNLDWKKILIGQMKYQEGQLVFEPGKLLKFIQSKLFSTEHKNSQAIADAEFRMINPPWFLDEFKIFWNKLQKERGFFANGKFHELPKGLSVTWAAASCARPDSVSIQVLNKNRHQWQYVLNQETFKRFFSIPVSQGEDKLNIKSGYLAESKELSVLVTETLLDGQWAELLDKANELGCKLNLIIAPRVTMPEILKPDPVQVDSKEVKEIKESKEKSVKIITSNDPEFLLQKHPQNTILYLSNDSNYKIVENWQSVTSLYNQETKYLNEEGILFQLLKAGKHVTLTGTLSEALCKRLQTLFANPPYLEYNGIKAEIGEGKLLTGKLSIVTKNNPFSFVNIPQVNVSYQDYFQDMSRENALLLKTLCEKLEITIQSFSQVQTMLKNLTQFPERNPVEWLLLLKNNPESMLEKGRKLHESLKPQVSNESKEEKITDELHLRLKEMDRRLHDMPFLFLIGPSGTGKSTTVLQELPSFYKEMKKEIKIFTTSPPDLESIKQWAQTKDDTMKFLFIDEANLAAEDTFDFVEGMLKKPPEIIYNGERIELTDQHKIIFAGNYQYYENRRLQNLFLKYDCIQHFPAFSPQYINEKQVLPLIKSVFKTTDEKSNAQHEKMVMDIFLRCMLDAKEIMSDVNLTVRNLQAMALAFGKLWKDSTIFSSLQTSERISLLAKWVFYQNARDALGSNEIFLKSKLFGTLADYNKLKHQFPRVQRGELGSIYITAPHKRAVAVLKEEMQVREIRNEIKSAGFATGTCGTLLAGVPGIGKSSVVINSLENLGFKNAAVETKNSDPSKVYYHLTLTNPKTMKKILLDAFHKGAVVVIDEINTFPLESLLNSLMMGVDNRGQTANRKGFYVVGTYNPIGSGRRILSPAVENRFRKIELADYTEKDLNKFLAAKYEDIPENIRLYFSHKYVQAKETTQPYNFRDLLSDIEYARDKVIAEQQPKLWGFLPNW